MNRELNILEDNVLMNHLKAAQDKKYYVAALLFCRLAEDQWETERLRYTVPHGYRHIRSIFSTLNLLFGKEPRYLDNLGLQYCFVLAAAVYAHDLGLQPRFYCARYPAFREQDELSHSQEQKVRDSHPEIISTLLKTLDQGELIEEFFGDNIVKSIRRICSGGNEHLVGESIELIADLHRQIALLCGFHREPMTSLIGRVDDMIVANDLAITPQEREDIIFCTACLQLGDAMDMSHDRIDEERLKYLLNNGLKRRADVRTAIHLAYADLQLVEKMFLCFLIDEIEPSWQGDVLSFKFHMSLRRNDREGHSEQIDKCKDKYLHRLKRSEFDCASIIESRLGIRIVIACGSERVKTNDSKMLIGPEFFSWGDLPQYRSLDEALKEHVERVSQESIFGYFKMYSATCRAFFDGISRDVVDRHLREQIQSFCFFENDFGLPKTRGFFLLRKGDFKKFKKNWRISLSYRDYYNFMDEQGIGYEVYYRIMDGDNVLGYINLHYRGEIDDREAEQLKMRLDELLYGVGIEIMNYHRETDVKEIKFELDNYKLLTSDLNDALARLYANRFDSSEDFGEHVEAVSIERVKEVLHVGNVLSGDAQMYILCSDEIFSAIAQLILNDSRINQVAEIGVNVGAKPYGRLCEIRFNLKLRNPHYMDYLHHAFAFLDSMDNRGLAAHRELKRYFLPLKIFATVFGGKIIPDLDVEGNSLEVLLLFPQRLYRELDPREQRRIETRKALAGDNRAVKLAKV